MEGESFLVGLIGCAGGLKRSPTLVNEGADVQVDVRFRESGKDTWMSGGRLSAGVDLSVALNAFMARDPHEVDAMDNFLES